jgi:hypothetical protein
MSNPVTVEKHRPYASLIHNSTGLPFVVFSQLLSNGRYGTTFRRKCWCEADGSVDDFLEGIYGVDPDGSWNLASYVVIANDNAEIVFFGVLYYCIIQQEAF